MIHVVKLALVLAGLIHLLPLAGALGAERLHALYGVTIDDAVMLLLMRHRAILFGLLGAFCLAAAFVPRLQFGALLLATGSVLSFVILACTGAHAHGPIGRVVAVDLAALAVLLAGIAAHLAAPPAASALR